MEKARGAAGAEAETRASYAPWVRRVARAVQTAQAHGLVQLNDETDRADGRTITVDGRRLVTFGSCSYLGLETDERLKRGAVEAVQRFGVQFASSRAYISSGLYAELEGRLERIFLRPVAIAQTSSLGHFAALPVLITPGDRVVYDLHVHASVQAVLPTLAARDVECTPLRHDDLAELEQILRGREGAAGRTWYLADGVYSMSGGRAPVGDLRWLLKRWENLRLYVDDAHGMSWSGRHGAGTLLGQTSMLPRTVVALSLAKAFSAGGAALVFEDAQDRDVVRSCGSTMMFSGPLQPALLGAAIASADVHLSSELAERQAALHLRIRRFNAQAVAAGLSIASRDETPIRFVEIGDDARACRVAERLMAAGLYVNVALFPAVARGCAGLRIALTTHHEIADIDGLVGRLAEFLA